jgi:hypothetical protein
MSETVTCPGCTRPLRVPEDYLGAQVKCPACGETFTASVAGAPAARRYEDEPPPRPRPRSEYAPRYEDEPPPPPRRAPARRRDDYDDYDDYDDRGRGRGGRRHLMPHRGGTVFALGLCSIFILPIVLGPIAWVMGNTDLREIRAGRMDPEGESQTSTGRTLGIVGTILGIVSLLFFIFFFVIVIMAASTAPAPRRTAPAGAPYKAPAPYNKR